MAGAGAQNARDCACTCNVSKTLLEHKHVWHAVPQSRTRFYVVNSDCYPRSPAFKQSLPHVMPKWTYIHRQITGQVLWAQMAGAFSLPGPLVRSSEMSGWNRTCQSGRITLHPDVQPGSTTQQTLFSGQGDVPLSGHTVNKFRRPAVLQLNIEGLAASKTNVLHHLGVQYEALVIFLHKTHCTCADKLTITCFALAGSSLSRKHGLATFVHDRLKWTLVDQSPATSETEWLCVDNDGYRIVNVYKPPSTRLQASDLPVFPHLVLYAGDFNCPHVNWVCRTSSSDGECLVAWASLNPIRTGLFLLSTSGGGGGGSIRPGILAANNF